MSLTPNHLDVLREQARLLPEMPGVYFWKDEGGQILYIGKAVNLRARVTSYFSSARRDSRIRKLVAQARSIEHEVTSTELEALFRESALIKRELPPFNRALRTPRRLFFLKLDRSRLHPYLEIVREPAGDESLYFGPFRSATVARETLQFVHAVLPLRKCIAAKPKCAPCLYYQMHTCAAPFLGEVEQLRHEEAIAHLHDLLDGRVDRIREWLVRKRDRLCDGLMYERAADIQDRIDALDQFASRQAILDAAVASRCVLIWCPEDERSSERVLLVAHGAVISALPRLDQTPATIRRWIRAHEPILRNAAWRERELDAASVLERWLTVNRAHVRWVALPPSAPDPDLLDRIAYVLSPAVP
jgi:excinuclease ABC subunit C